MNGLSPIVLEHSPGWETAGQGVAFLDRDGVLNENIDDHVRERADVRIIPGAAAALRRLAGARVAMVVVTNQAVINRGLVPVDQVIDVHCHLLTTLGTHGVVASYVCPHSPEDRCRCRKPMPGMIVEAVRRYGFDLTRSVIIGDARTDILAGKRAGIRSALVLTGRGREQAALSSPADTDPDAVFADLNATVDWAIEHTAHHVKGPV